MRFYVVFVVVAASSIAGAAACSSSEGSSAVTPDAAAPATPDSGSEETEEGAADAAPPPACVSPVKTKVAKCNECLQKHCCQVIVDCLDDPDCDDLTDCYNNCARLGRETDAGQKCVRGCTEDHPKSAQKLLDMLECQFDSCGTPCKG